MKKSNIYTRTGDHGTTSLVGGTRISKASLRLDSYGTIDELNSHLGLLLTYVTEEEDRQQLILAQHRLFSIGGILATPPSVGTEQAPLRPSCTITAAHIAQLEQAIDRAADGLPAWRGFTLPGGSRAAAVAHVCRTVCRRAERVICALAEQQPVPELVATYVNRLSDYLYALSLRLNFLSGTEEILWDKAR